MQRMARQNRDEDGLGRFGKPGVLILLALCDGPKHGYAMTVDGPYEITQHGRSALSRQLATWSRVVATGRTRLATT